MKNTFRKSTLITSVALLLVAIVALGGATFAWFSSNPTATASGVSTSAKAAAGLLITTTPLEETSWTNALTLYSGAEAKSLTPVSSNFETKGSPAWYTANASSASAFDADESTITEVKDINGYVEKYVVYAKTQDGTSSPLYLTATIAETAGNFGRVAVVCDSKIVYYKNDTTEEWAPLDKDGNVATAKGFTETSSIASEEIGTIPEGGNLAVTIYVWNEGQDPGCTTNTSVEALTASFSFSLNK